LSYLFSFFIVSKKVKGCEPAAPVLLPPSAKHWLNLK